MKRRLWLAAVICGGLSADAVHADSIWDRRDPRAAFLFQDNRARAVGDLLTISVIETTNTNEREQRAMEKATDGRLTTTYAGSSASTKNSLSGSLSFDLRNQTDRKFNGSSQLTSDRSFTDKMTVTVVDIMPNGNLVVEGFRSRVVSGEERMLRITGIVRPADIANGNTVNSASVANFRISYLGRGPETRYLNPSYLSRAMNLLWPW